MSEFVPIEEVMQALQLTKRQVYRDIDQERIPGFFRYTGKRNRTAYVLRHEWNLFLRREWTPKSDRPRVGLHEVPRLEKVS